MQKSADFTANRSMRGESPWWWVPTLYFAEGIPYFIVNNISVLMLAKMGVPNGQMSLVTSLLYLPWMIKPFWSPFVDVIRTKRWWIIAMQLLMALCFILLTVSLPAPSAESIASGTTPVSLFTLSLFLFAVTAFASATHDIAADGFYMLALSTKRQAAFVGIRSTFYRLSSIFGQGVLVYIAGYCELHGIAILGIEPGDIPASFTLTMGVTALIFSCVALYHTYILPRPAADAPRGEGRVDGDATDGCEDAADGCKDTTGKVSEIPQGGDARRILREFADSFVTFFSKKGLWLAIAFMLLYRLPEAFLLKMCTPFLLADKAVGGLGLTTENVGVVYGVIGVFFLTVGGILGGIYASKRGLRRSLWVMAACMTLPCLTFCYLAEMQPDNLWYISIAVAIEQFGYGFGFTAYMLYMMYFSEGEFTTSHYAICTAFMAMSMMLPGLVAGYLQEYLGYAMFFWMVIGCCIATLAVTFYAVRRIAPDYGLK